MSLNQSAKAKLGECGGESMSNEKNAVCMEMREKERSRGDDDVKNINKLVQFDH